jgi:chaperonin GroES
MNHNIKDSRGDVRVADTLFYNPYLRIGMKPEAIEPLFDRVLLKDVPDEEMLQGIFIPEMARFGVGKNGLLREAVVVAVGPGDKQFERMVRTGAKMARLKVTHWTGRAIGWRTDLQVKVGDRVITDRRKEAELYIDGERYQLVYEQQAILAVLQSGDDMHIRPLYDRIVVKRDEAEKIASGIFIPENAAQKPQRGEVVAVGAGKRCDDGTMIPLDVQVGDSVLFGKMSGSEVLVDGKQLLIMRENEVLARLREV